MTERLLEASQTGYIVLPLFIAMLIYLICAKYLSVSSLSIAVKCMYEFGQFL